MELVSKIMRGMCRELTSPQECSNFHSKIPLSKLWISDSGRFRRKSIMIASMKATALLGISHSPAYFCLCASSKAAEMSCTCPYNTVATQHLLLMICLIGFSICKEPASYFASMHTSSWRSFSASFLKASDASSEKASPWPIKILAQFHLK